MLSCVAGILEAMVHTSPRAAIAMFLRMRMPMLRLLLGAALRAPGGRIDHKAAWMFLASTIYAGDAEPRPIDRLRAAAGTARTGNALFQLALAKESLDYGNHV